MQLWNSQFALLGGFIGRAGRLIACSLMAIFFVAHVASAQEKANPIVSDACGAGTLSIAQMQWPSASILAQIHALLLREKFACQVDIVPGDLGATSAAMANTGYPHIAPEMWVGRVASLWNMAIEAQTMRPAAPSFSGASLEGWFVPDYMHVAQPELRAVADWAKAIKALAAKGEKIQFISCPEEWACALINKNLLAAYGLMGSVDVVEPLNRFEFDKLIVGAISRQEKVLFYYWRPNGFLTQFSAHALDMGVYNGEAMLCLAQRDCATPVASSFVPEQVLIALSEAVYVSFPIIAAYFQRASMPIDVMNDLLAWQNEAERSAEEVAAHFVATHEDVWRAWLAQ